MTAATATPARSSTDPEIAMYLRQLSELRTLAAINRVRRDFRNKAQRTCRRYDLTAANFNAAARRQAGRLYPDAAGEGTLQNACALSLAAGSVLAHLEASDPALED